MIHSCPLFTCSCICEAHHLQTTIDQLPNSELADEHLFHGMANYNSKRAARMYRERFLNRHVPAHQIFAAIHRRLGETGTISVARPDAGRSRAVRDPDMEDDILDHFHNAPTASTRAVASVLHVSRMTVWRVLHENLQYPIIHGVLNLSRGFYNNEKKTGFH